MTMQSGFIEQCEQEQLHLSGAIQPHGVLVVSDLQGTISHVSENILHWLGVEAGLESLLDQPLPAFLEEVHSRAPTLSEGERYTGQSNIGSQEFDVVISHNGEQLIFELYPVDAHADPMPKQGEAYPVPENRQALEAQCQQLLDTLLALSGFDRIHYYRFMPEGDGEVTAEARQPEVAGSYLGLRFPASDIPQIARQLYMKNPWRSIPNSSAEPVAVVGRERNAIPNLSWVDLRSVSPVHLEYMANMGVGAAISLPITQAGTLDALISCHSAVPKQLTVSQLQAMSALSEAFNLRLRDYKARRRLQVLDGMQRQFDQAKDVLMRHGELASAWPELSHWLMDSFAADGAILQVGGDTYHAGEGLSAAGIEVVAEAARFETSSVWISDSLRSDCPDMPLSEIAGVAVVSDLPLDQYHSVNLYLCRLEHLYEVTWGGNPDKPVDYRDGSRGIAPRRSFEAWVEQRMGHSRPWSANTRMYLLKLRALLQQAKSFARKMDE
ncbi:GAF domain-containing protein [Halomonas sp. ISL-60]|uniref:GAF domain-containing protein n=1 Tax=Halomonas sp. ISL-56 TaxID=2819149 RepID=UPI001BEA79D6|nr:GAF domain-containing protein [Halomonas sp. ISL-56]MBT2770754.1 GAF domain-containing protein [Halomonas sp. ISL-60]MBT2803882.1 GAF domain-containing protein [Halomonas sp. ISL-56]